MMGDVVPNGDFVFPPLPLPLSPPFHHHHRYGGWNSAKETKVELGLWGE